MKLLRSRKAISYGVVVALITIVALASASVIAGWIVSVGTRAGRQALLRVAGSPVIQFDNAYSYVIVSITNIGNTPATVTSCIYRGVTVGIDQVLSGDRLIQPGASATFRFRFTGDICPTIGDTREFTLVTDQGNLAFTAYRQG
jgi:hypothetical protein